MYNMLSTKKVNLGYETKLILSDPWWIGFLSIFGLWQKKGTLVYDLRMDQGILDTIVPLSVNSLFQHEDHDHLQKHEKGQNEKIGFKSI